MDKAGPTQDDGREESFRTREKVEERNERITRLRKRLTKQEKEIEDLRARLARAVRAEPGAETGIRPENVVWIFGSGRTGSTWLSSMMADLGGHTLWHEPLVGELFGNLYYVRGKGNQRNEHFILGRHRETWLKSIRSFVLDGANARFPEAADGGLLVVKEPNGSIGAPLMMEALPESRMVLLVRDPRDVVASSLDARREGSWLYEKSKERSRRQPKEGPEEDSLAFVKGRARGFLQRMENSKAAYEAHEGPKALVRYEDLRADALGTMERLYSTLGIPVDGEELTRVVDEHSWENIPEGEKGEGKFYRKASPGGWREDLTPEQARAVEEITRPILEAFYPDA